MKKITKSLCIALICTIACSPRAFAQDKDEAQKYLEKAEKVTVIKSRSHGKKKFENLLKAAELGSARAQFKMGELLSKNYCPNWACDRGLTRNEAYYHEYNDKEALEWFKKSAAQGYKPADYYIAEFTYRGWGTQKDEAKGLQLLVDFAENCFKNNLKNMAGYLWNSRLFYYYSGSNLYRTELADKNSDAAYVADVIQYFGYAYEEASWKSHPAFMRALWRGNEKAVDALRVLAEQGKQYAKDVFVVKDEDARRIKKLKKSMDEVLALGEPAIVPDVDRNYINRIHWTHRATDIGKMALEIRSFYYVNEALALDPTTKKYAGGFFATDHASVDLQQMREAIKICKEKKNSEYHTYYDNCIPILEQKTKFIKALEKNQNDQLRGALRSTMSKMLRPIAERKAEMEKQEAEGNAISVPQIKNEETGSHGREIDSDTNYTDYDYYVFDDNVSIKVYHRYFEGSLIASKDNYYYPENNMRDIKYETAADAARAGWVYKIKKKVRTLGQLK